MAMCRVEQAFELAAFLLDRSWVDMMDWSNSLGCPQQIDTFLCSHRLASAFQTTGMTRQVSHDRTRAPATKAGHAMLDIGEEAFPPHFPIINNIDPCFDLFRDDGARCALDSLLQHCILNGHAGIPGGMERRQ